MSDLTMIRLHKSTPGAAAWLDKALDRVVEGCRTDPHAETDGTELGQHLVESFCLDLDRARYCFLIGVNGTEIRGHIIARIDTLYEGRHQCWVGFFNLDRGYHWEDLIPKGLEVIEEWARGHECPELLVSVYSQAHARLYRRPRYGGFTERNLVMSRRIEP